MSEGAGEAELRPFDGERERSLDCDLIISGKLSPSRACVLMTVRFEECLLCIECSDFGLNELSVGAICPPLEKRPEVPENIGLVSARLKLGFLTLIWTSELDCLRLGPERSPSGLSSGLKNMLAAGALSCFRNLLGVPLMMDAPSG